MQESKICLRSVFRPPEGQNSANTGKNCINFWRWSGYISMPHFNWFIPSMHSPSKARKPQFHLVFSSPEGRHWVNTGQNRITSGGGQDTSACHILGHSFHVFSLECSETSPDGWTDADQCYVPIPLRRQGQLRQGQWSRSYIKHIIQALHTTLVSW